MTIRGLRLGRLPYSLIALIVSATTTLANEFPYIPTRLFTTTQQNNNYTYILDPPSTSLPQGRLRFVTVSSSFSASNPSAKTISPSLPFYNTNLPISYTTSLDPSGALNVLVGSCSAGAEGTSLWTFTPTVQKDNFSGAWSQPTINSKTITGPANQVGVNYLGSSVSFAATSKENASIYNFAGMCPYANSTDGDWVSAAAYSNQLLILDHEQASEYDFELGSGRGQPISEAGFSITGLQPTFSPVGDGSQSISQNFLLLGGHTQDAFINMSQVALFSLPQASWTFLPVNDDPSNGELRSRQAPQQTEPRSGHTAVLSSDGSKVIMFGGWVGDTNTPAEPQLAVMNVGAGYGGTGDWSWDTAPAQPQLAAGTSGIYGHGATMLNGDVMVVIGGWSIPGGGASRIRRGNAPITNTQNFLFNVSSGSWIQDYTPPPAQTSAAASSDNGGLLSTKQQKVGLGVGLTFGILAIVVAVIIGWLISRRFKKQLRSREEELREKEIDDMHRFETHYPGYYMDDGPYQRPTSIWDGRSQNHINNEPNMWRNDSIREAERSGMDLDIPSPQRGLRRSMASRTMHSGRAVDERRISRGSGIIHPIQEAEEEEQAPNVVTPSEQLEDPFQDPQLTQAEAAGGATEHEKLIPGIESPSPEPQPMSPTEEKTQETTQWVQAWAASTSNRPLPSPPTGRVSPDKSERTESNLSDRSNVSGLTARTHGSSTDSSVSRPSRSTPSPTYRPPQNPLLRRSLRLLPGTLTPFSYQSASPTSPTRSRHSLTPTSQPPNTADSFKTAHTTFATLQSESDALLGPAHPGQAGFKPQSSQPSASLSQGTTVIGSHVLSQSDFDPYAPDNEPTFVARGDAHKAPTGKVGSWVGSVRRAVASAGRSASLTSSGGAKARAMAQVGPSGGLTIYDSAGRSEESPASSPTKKGGVTSEEWLDKWEGDREGVRRSASEGATKFLMKRKGAEDWGWDADKENEPSPEKGKERSQSLVGDVQRPAWMIGEGAEAKAGDEWDVERAVEGRNIQVMFSVPKERLRVVNADVDAMSIASSRRSASGQSRAGGEEGVGRGENDGGIIRVRSRRSTSRLKDVEE